MANKTAEKENEVKTNNVAKEVDYVFKWEEARENLVIQLKESNDKYKESLEQAEFHKTRSTKIQGVIEVNDQLFLKEENNEDK